MEVKYKIIAEVRILHSYFKDGMAKNLIITPSENTKNTLTKYGFIFRNTENGFVLLETSSRGQFDALQYLTNTLGIKEFEFNFYSTDTTFYNYTEVPLNQIGILEYSNLSLQPENEEGIAVMKEKFRATDLTNSLGSINLNLEELISQTSTGPVTFEIHFEARKMQWNYFIISQEEIKGLKIKGKSEMNFEGPEEVTLINNVNAQKFSSGSNLLPVQEFPNLKFDLIQTRETDSSNVRPTMIFEGLPNASPHTIGITNIEGRQVASSEMYVYI